MRILTVVSLVLFGNLAACDPTPSVSPGVEVMPDGGSGDTDREVQTNLPPASKITVATFNVSRFFDTTCDTGECWNGSYEEHPTPSEFNAKRTELADAMNALNADIIVLQEVENQACLNELTKSLKGDYKTSVIGETGAPGSLDVVTLSRGETLDVRKHRNYSIPHPDGGWTKFAREFLEVHLDWNGWRVIVFNAHFKSKINDDPGRRLAEAIKARDIIEATAAEFPDAFLVLAGDLNDVPNSAPLNELESGGFMQRIAKEIPSGGDWTYNYFGNFRAIDHIFLITSGKGTFESGTAKVHRDGTSAGWGGSDHGALTGTFTLEP